MTTRIKYLGIRLGEKDTNPDPPQPKGPNDSILTSPLVLDLDGDGVETVGLDRGIQFDMDNNGFRETVGWVHADDGLLALDRNGNGVTDNGSELFGNNTTLENGNKAANGFLALADFDDNRDGVINQNNTVWNDLRVWRDLDQNGESGAGELFTLDELGIASLKLSYTNSNSKDEFGNEFRQSGSYTDVNGDVRQMVDVCFNSTPTGSRPPALIYYGGF